ncbi:hypothetical protein SUGI_1137560 [Cryptomeria japonica]|nr:hypothetical protein SUGI_1137560 [Cryptomeria japonica]
MAFYKISSAFFLFFLLWIALPFLSVAEIPREIAEKIERVNRKGELYGLVVSSRAELEVVLDERSGTFRPDRELPTIYISGLLPTQLTSALPLLKFRFDFPLGFWFLYFTTIN